MTPVTATYDRERSESAIRSVEAAYDVAWNAGDVASLVGLLTSDVVVVDPFGGVSTGREAMKESLDSLLAGEGSGSIHRSEILGVHFVTNDVAVVDGEALIEGFVAADSEAKSPIRHRFTDVLVRTDGVWLIAQVRAYVHMGRQPA